MTEKTMALLESLSTEELIKIRKDLDISWHKDDHIELKAGSKTSHSLDAYDKFLEGSQFINKGDFESAMKVLQETIKIDSTFFDAYYLMAIAKWWLDGSEANNIASDYCKMIIDKKIYNDKNPEDLL